MSWETTEKSISTRDADRLISAHDGDVALLYIFRLRHGCTDREKEAAALCRTLREIEAADEKLRRMGLCSAPAASATARAGRPLLPESDNGLPEYKAEDLSRRSKEDPGFAAVVAEAKKVMGRSLSSVDMRTLFAIYDYLGLSAEVMLLLINYCGKVFEEKYHGQRRPTARSIQKEATRWAEREIITPEQADEYIAARQQRTSVMGRVQEALGIRSRELSRTEREYIESWLDMGFGEEELTVAFDRTVTNTGALKWSYMNKIVQSWKEKGLMTVQDIMDKDSRSRRNYTPTTQKGDGTVSDLNKLAEMIKKI